MENSYTYLTTEELAGRIKYDCRTIRQCLKDTVLLEGKHYIKPFGRRKIHDHRSEEQLTLEIALGQSFHNLLKQDPLVGHVLVNNRDPLVVDRDDERVSELPKW